MHTYLDCIPCFYSQALRTARLAGADAEKQKKILNKVAEIMKKIDLKSAPPIIAGKVYAEINNIIGDGDIFRKIKKDSNDTALKLYERVKEQAENSDDFLLYAVKAAIAGNIIDFGISAKFDIKKELENIIHKKLGVFDYEKFRKKLEMADNVLYIGDNAGEIVFDKLLIEYIIKKNKNVIFAVRSKPAINDVLMEDARMCGLDKICRVIKSGSGVPGTPLEICSEEFLNEFKKANIIISKGQGNIETLIQEKGPIFFMLQVKCAVIAQRLKCNMFEAVLKENN